MSRTMVLLLVAGLCLATGFGCSHGNTPTTPQSQILNQVQDDGGVVQDDRPASQNDDAMNTSSQIHLWGYYDVSIDPLTQTVAAIPNRGIMFTANVVNFLNKKEVGLKFHVNAMPVEPDYIDADIDISLTHPFPGLAKYNGYDVRGVFMGDGSGTLAYNSDLHYSIPGTDQLMLADSVDGFGDPDGYTRWFNKPEFSTGGMPLLQYTPGKMATPDFDGNATLNPYKYFADNLGKDEKLSGDWFETNIDKHGVFSHSSTNTRNYYLRFPNTKGKTFGYAILANWNGPDPKDHPANTPEAVACSIINKSDVYYVDLTDNGGTIRLVINLFGWGEQPSAIFIESTVLSAPHEFTVDEMIPIGGSEISSTYVVEIPADHVMGIPGNEFWIIAQYDSDYTNPFGTSNLADTDKLAACFRYDLAISDLSPRWTRTFGGIYDDGGISIATDQNGNVYTTGYFTGTVDLDPSAGIDTHTAIGSTDIFLSKLTPDGNFEWARTWGGTSIDRGYDVIIDNSGNIYVTGEFDGAAGEVDFDPGNGVDNHVSVGNSDVFLSKFSADGNFEWARTWGGIWEDGGADLATDNSGNIYVTGYISGPEGDVIDGIDGFLQKFDPMGNPEWNLLTWGGSGSDHTYSRSVALDNNDGLYVTGSFTSYNGATDFNPDPNEADNHWANNNDWDIYLSKFDLTGNFQWAKTWGGPEGDHNNGVATDSFGNIYTSGQFQGIVDFDPDGGTDIHTAIGGTDICFSKFDAAGNFQWAKTWGGPDMDFSENIATDGFDRLCVTGVFGTTADFDPGSGEDWHTANYMAFFLSRFDPTGSFQWAKTWGGNGDTIYGGGVAVDYLGHAFVTGSFQATADFDPGSGTDKHTSNGSWDVFVSRF